jgi:hypothetical protein
MYTIEQLKEENGSYNSEHGVDNRDVNVTNAYIALVAISRTHFAPKPGDVFYGKDGKRYHIDSTENEYLKKGAVTIVENAYVPFIRGHLSDSRAKIVLSTSGGPWTTVDAEKMEHVDGETEEKKFCFFGHCGFRGNGAVEFKTRVNVWREL